MENSDKLKNRIHNISKRYFGFESDSLDIYTDVKTDMWYTDSISLAKATIEIPSSFN